MSLDQQPNPSPQLTAPALTNFVAEAAPAGPEGQPSVIRQYLQMRGSGGIADRVFAGLMLLCGLSIFAIVLFILWIQDRKSTRLNSSHLGISYFSPFSHHAALPFCGGEGGDWGQGFFRFYCFLGFGAFSPWCFYFWDS